MSSYSFLTNLPAIWFCSLVRDRTQGLSHSTHMLARAWMGWELLLKCI